METLKEFKLNLDAVIKESDQVFISPHLYADFDAIASAIGFSLISTKCSKPNYIFMYDDPYKMEPGVKAIIEESKSRFSYIGIDRYLKLKGDQDLLITTDTNKSNLIGCSDYLDQFKRVITLDHHDVGEQTISTNFQYISTEVSSTSEMMVDLLCQFGIKYDSDIANYLLSGIYLDTDKLQKRMSPKTFQIVSKLLTKGANLEKVQEFFAEDFKNDQKIWALIQKTVLFTNTYAVAIEDSDTIYTREDLAKVADKLLNYRAVDASFAVGKVDENVVSISARSRGRVDVSKIMSLMAGGGNVYSAATKIEDESTEEIGKTLIKTLKPGFFVEE